MAREECENSCGLAAPVQPREQFSCRRVVISFPQVACLLLILCGMHVLLRGLVSETAGIDDVDQILRAQVWSWGYGPQPPLYTWLTKIFLSVFGYSVMSMLLLKELIIFTIYALVYFTTRRITTSHLCALISTALLQANFSIAWEAHRELTHTVLVSAFSMGVLYSFLCLNGQSWRSYVWFGLCCGLGMIAKYNFAIVWLSLLLAAMTLREMRSLLFNIKMLVALVIMLGVCAPHFIWFLQHQDLGFSSVHKLQIVASGNWSSVTQGLLKWVLAILAHAGPVSLVLVLMFGRNVLRFTLETLEQQVLLRTLGCILVIVTVNLVVFRVSGVRDRYVQPFFVWFPVLAIAGLRHAVTVRHAKLLLPIAAVSAAAIALAAPGRVLLTEKLKKNEVLNTPFHRLAQDLAPSVKEADCIVAENHPLAGNLRLQFPHVLVLDPEVGPLFTNGHRRTLLVWDATKNPSMPDELATFARGFAQANSISAVKIHEELLKYHHTRTIRIGSAMIQ